MRLGAARGRWSPCVASRRSGRSALDAVAVVLNSDMDRPRKRLASFSVPFPWWCLQIESCCVVDLQGSPLLTALHRH